MKARTIAFSTIANLCRGEGIEALATINVPETLDPAGLDTMVADGIGDMAFMTKYRSLRLSPAKFLPGARTILATAFPYQPVNAEQLSETSLKRARYAAGKDYHRLLRRKLSNVGKQLLGGNGAGYPYRACVDSAPVMERMLAHKAGLGWIGRNALIINPKRGSYQFLGFLFTHAPLELCAADFGKDRCGSCQLCHAACPTDALVSRRVISERCISYLTIEHKGVIPGEFAKNFRGWWFGCDICQEVCPWNRFAPEAADGRLNGTDEESTLLSLSEREFDSYFAGRAVKRINYQQFRRNLLVALWSVGRIEEARAISATGEQLVIAQAQELGLK